MGFSLEGMFSTLFFILNDNETDEIDKLAALEQYINEAHQYAIDCGQLTKKVE